MADPANSQQADWKKQDEIDEEAWKKQEEEDNLAMQRAFNVEELDEEESAAMKDMLNFDRPLNFTGAEDAEDFADISDDDLPEEEEATGARVADVPSLTDDTGTSNEAGTSNENEDLWGENGRDSSPMFDEEHDEYTQNGVAPAPQVTGGLTLPSLVPVPTPATEYKEDLLSLNFPEHRPDTNQDLAIPAPAENKKELVQQMFPGFRVGITQFWNSLIPPKTATWIYKNPEKVPKPLNPTKVSLDLAPDQEKSFRTAGPAIGDKRKRVQEAEAKGLVAIVDVSSDEQESEDDLDWKVPDPSEKVGGFSFADLEIICEDWEAKIDAAVPAPVQVDVEEEGMDEWDREFLGHSSKRRKIETVEKDYINAPRFAVPSFDEFEKDTKRVAKRVLLDLNDPYLLVDTQDHGHTKRRRLNNGVHKGVSSSLSQRFNLSNDEAYDALKQNHKEKVRATLGNLSVEHSMPALRLQWPYYRTKLYVKEARSFHRPSLKFNRIMNQPITFSKPLLRKKKQVKGLQTHEIFKNTKDLTLAEHYSSATLLEYSEEHPIVLSNFGMGNKIINYYRRKSAEDNDRPPPEDKVGDVTALLPEDKSPFNHFGEIKPGETVRAIHNAMFRAPIFKHEPKNTDFLVIRSSTGVDGMKWHIRNIDHMFAVGQQLPSVEVPGPHSRKVTNAAKYRMKMIGLRKMRHNSGQAMKISEITEHIAGSTDMQNRQKLKDHFQYDKTEKLWKMKPGEILPDEATIRNYIKPEDVCGLDAMQVGVRHLEDAGYQVTDKEGRDEDEDSKEKDVDADDDKDGKKTLEFQLAPWRTSKAFLEASNGKAMLKLHGEGDPSGRGLAISMIKTSMKGGYVGALQGPSATSAAAIAAEKKANGGHGYNVKKQEELYQAACVDIWEKQKANLSDPFEHPENDLEAYDEDDRFDAAHGNSSGAQGFDDSASQISRLSTNETSGRMMRITRSVKNSLGQIEEVTEIVKDPKVWREYMRRCRARDGANINVYDYVPTGDPEQDRIAKEKIVSELGRLEKNKDRRIGREKQKGFHRASPMPASAGSPSATPAPTIEKPTGTTRKCANCGQTGHIKTNKKYCFANS
ncbi:hypothetical protein B0J14DRAFT_278412 [Halenospora varia]|nr:hypothetical protein B0J14DRAFT_278412 [Halenospora varia]